MKAIHSCRALAWLPALFFAGASQAHVTLEYQVASAARPYKATFRVGHGCGASPTRQLSVAIPAGVKGARPMPKPGWSVDIQKDTDVTRVTWNAKTRDDMLPTTQYDEFVLVAQMPKEAGPLRWPVVQQCEEGRADWTADLEVIPAGDTAAGHQH